MDAWGGFSANLYDGAWMRSQDQTDGHLNLTFLLAQRETPADFAANILIFYSNAAALCFFAHVGCNKKASRLQKYSSL